LEVDNFPESFDPTRCVLFLGAGFSANATNGWPNGKYQNPPVGEKLNQAMKEMAGIPLDESSEFTDTAGYILSKKLDLFGLLEKLYTVKAITSDQRMALSLPWWRIYSTNYDNSVSVFKSTQGIDISSNVFDLTDDPPKQLRKGAVIHLHGSIAKCDSTNLQKSLVLTRRSYVEQRVKKSSWWDWFDRDVALLHKSREGFIS